MAGVALSDVFSTETLKQHPFGTVMIAVDVTLKKFTFDGAASAAAAGVTIALDVRIGSPSRANEIDIGAGAVPPSGTAMFPLNVTWYLAKQAFGLLTMPLRVIIPDSLR